jgi:hypothetical protein
MISSRLKPNAPSGFSLLRINPNNETGSPISPLLELLPRSLESDQIGSPLEFYFVWISPKSFQIKASFLVFLTGFFPND